MARSKPTRDQRDPRDCAIFDDAQNIVLKELLPFWAGFTRQYDAQSAEQETEKLPRKHWLNFESLKLLVDFS